MGDGWKTVFRWVAAALFFGVGVYLLIHAFGGGSMLGMAATLIGGFLMWLVAAICVAPDVAGWLAAPWGNLYFPSARNEKPPPHYSLAEAKVQRDDFEGALADYVGMTIKYPEEARPYYEMIDIIFQHLHDPERADVVYHKGLETLKKPEARDELERRYRAAASRAADRPEWGQVHTVAYQEEAPPSGGYRNAPERGHVPNPLRTSKPKSD